MRNKYRVWMLLASIATMVVIVGSVGLVGAAETNPDEGLRFAYISHGDPGDPFHAAIVVGWLAAAETLGIDATVHFAHGCFATTIDLVDTMIAAEVDGIFVFSVDPDGLHPSVRLAVEKGINIVLMSSRDPVFGPEEVPFVGFDLEDQGYTLGRHMAAQLRAAGLVSDVNISFFAEFIAPYSVLRRRGFLRALANAEIGYIASDIFEVGVDMGVVFDTIKIHLLAHPETDVILGLGSLTTAAAVMALQALDFEPAEVKWTGFDLLPETVVGVRAGFGAVNVDEVFNYGFLGALTLYLRVKHGLVVGDLPVATVMVDLANIDEFVD